MVIASLPKEHESLSDHDTVEQSFDPTHGNRRHHHHNDNNNNNSLNYSSVEDPPVVVLLPAQARWVPGCLRYDRGAPMEATGISVDKWATGPIFMSSLFLGPSLLQLATEAAGCVYTKTDDNDDALAADITTAVCENKIYGFRPSSLLTNMAVATGLLVPIFLPLVGAIVDHTPYRKQVAQGTALALAIVKGIEVAVGKSTWFVITILQVWTGVLYNIHVTVTYAYNSELSAHPHVQATYNSFFSMVQFSSMLTFLIIILVLSTILQTDDVGTARLSQTITCVSTFIPFWFTWRYLFGNRPASCTIRPGHTLLTSGFSKVWDSTRRIAKDYKPLFWVICSLMFAEAATSSLSTIATTFLTQVLHMTSSEIGLVFLVVLLAGIPGSWLGGWTTVRLHSPVRSAIVCNIFLCLVTIFASIHLRGPEHKTSAYLYAGLWGAGLGWLSPVDTTLFISVMPKDSRAEFMGIYMLAASMLTWLPPMFFSLLNESGINMSWGLASLDIFFALAIVFLCLVGDYEKAVANVVEERVEMMSALQNDDPTDHHQTRLLPHQPHLVEPSVKGHGLI